VYRAQIGRKKSAARPFKATTIDATDALGCGLHRMLHARRVRL